MLADIYCTDNANLRYEEIQGVAVDRDYRGLVSGITLDKKHAMTLLTGYSSHDRHICMGRLLHYEDCLNRVKASENRVEVVADRLVALERMNRAIKTWVAETGRFASCSDFASCNMLVNEALTGKPCSLDKAELSSREIEVQTLVRERLSDLLGMGMTLKVIRQPLMVYGAKLLEGKMVVAPVVEDSARAPRKNSGAETQLEFQF
jgi:hypothetical protein